MEAASVDEQPQITHLPEVQPIMGYVALSSNHFDFYRVPAFPYGEPAYVPKWLLDMEKIGSMYVQTNSESDYNDMFIVQGDVHILAPTGSYIVRAHDLPFLSIISEEEFKTHFSALPPNEDKAYIVNIFTMPYVRTKEEAEALTIPHWMTELGVTCRHLRYKDEHNYYVLDTRFRTCLAILHPGFSLVMYESGQVAVRRLGDTAVGQDEFREYSIGDTHD